MLLLQRAARPAKALCRARVCPGRFKSAVADAGNVVYPQTIRSVKDASSSSTTVPKAVGYWLLGMSGLVAGMVTVGGITRLTRSGLSMTDWKLQGSLPPMNKEEWMVEFDRYKQFPEWQQRKNMTLDEFKFIFFWEYGHRMMGRSLGIAFSAPLAYFYMKGMIPKHLNPRMALLFALGGGQGLIGWWMVKSGLANVDANKEIRVSPYRLATHLGMAFTTYGTLLWTALEIMRPTQNTLKDVVTASLSNKNKKGLSQEVLNQVRKLRGVSLVNLGLVATTVISGAYVAGNDAGNAYNTWPKMGDVWIPEGILEITPMWRNFTENTATVQFDHRVLAISTLASVTGMFALAKTAAGGQVWKQVLPKYSRSAIHAAAGMSLVQVGLGISTLLLYVPIPLAAAHQAGSLVLLTFSTAAVHSLRFSPLLRAGSAAAGAAKVIKKIVV